MAMTKTGGVKNGNEIYIFHLVFLMRQQGGRGCYYQK